MQIDANNKRIFSCQIILCTRQVRDDRHVQTCNYTALSVTYTQMAHATAEAKKQHQNNKQTNVYRKNHSRKFASVSD